MSVMDGHGSDAPLGGPLCEFRRLDVRTFRRALIVPTFLDQVGERVHFGALAMNNSRGYFSRRFSDGERSLGADAHPDVAHTTHFIAARVGYSAKESRVRRDGKIVDAANADKSSRVAGLTESNLAVASIGTLTGENRLALLNGITGS